MTLLSCGLIPYHLFYHDPKDEFERQFSGKNIVLKFSISTGILPGIDTSNRHLFHLLIPYPVVANLIRVAYCYLIFNDHSTCEFKNINSQYLFQLSLFCCIEEIFLVKSINYKSITRALSFCFWSQHVPCKHD